MSTPKLLCLLGCITIPFSVSLAASQSAQGTRQGGGETVQIQADDIGGVVASAKGPEAGVWVIAETTELPTRFAKIVVTDEQGRYVIPDLPTQTTTYGCAATGWWIRQRCRQSRARL